ncbi:hypothetical protein PvtlMGM1_2134 [Prevotella sp. MGM1]|nr:hypothetical protein PvtlMGM1_2134 [Prevotella sp. MGM1]
MRTVQNEHYETDTRTNCNDFSQLFHKKLNFKRELMYICHRKYDLKVKSEPTVYSERKQKKQQL